MQQELHEGGTNSTKGKDTGGVEARETLSAHITHQNGGGGVGGATKGSEKGPARVTLTTALGL